MKYARTRQLIIIAAGKLRLVISSRGQIDTSTEYIALALPNHVKSVIASEHINWDPETRIP